MGASGRDDEGDQFWCLGPGGDAEATGDPVAGGDKRRAAHREDVGGRAGAAHSAARLRRRGHVRDAVQDGKGAGLRSIEHRTRILGSPPRAGSWPSRQREGAGGSVRLDVERQLLAGRFDARVGLASEPVPPLGHHPPADRPVGALVAGQDRVPALAALDPCACPGSPGRLQLLPDRARSRDSTGTAPGRTHRTYRKCCLAQLCGFSLAMRLGEGTEWARLGSNQRPPACEAAPTNTTQGDGSLSNTLGCTGCGRSVPAVPHGSVGTWAVVCATTVPCCRPPC